MDLNILRSVLAIGETIGVEFKRCGNGIESDVYESVCSFLNRFGGDIYMGILDDGTVIGVPEKAAPDMVKNFIKTVSNPMLFSPTVYLVPEIIKYDDTHTIIHVHVPPSAEVHSFIFKIIVPLNDEYSYDFETNRIETDNADKVQKSADKIRESADKVQESADKTQESADKLLAQYKLILDYTEKNGKITSRQAEELLNVKQRRAREVLSKMVDKGTLIKQGAYKSTVYMLNKERGK